MIDRGFRAADSGTDGPGRILVVDDEPAMLRHVSAWLERDGYRCETARSAEEGLALWDAAEFDVVITDVHMPRMSGIDLLKAIKEGDSEAQVIIITGNPNVDFAVEAIRSRVDDYLVKPFELAQLSHAVQRALEHRVLLKENRAYRLDLERTVQKQARHIERLFLDGLAALAGAVEARDRYTGNHLDRVTAYALSTGAELGLDERRVWNLWLSSLFHDVGKLAIPDAILNKRGPLSDRELRIMKRHPELGVRVIERATFLRAAIPGILHHQERWDGTGYPAGLRGEQISIEGRILSVSDAYDAMCTDRPYRKARSEAKAVAELERCAGTQFDPNVVRSFLKARSNGFPLTFPTSLYSALVSEN